MAVECDAPEPILLDGAGKVISKDPSPAFAAWAKEHSLSIPEAAGLVLRTYPSDINVFAHIKDPRVVEVLREGLKSRNSLIFFSSAQHLVGLNDTASIPLMLERLPDLKPDVAKSLVGTLAYFSGPDVEGTITKAIVNPDLLHTYKESLASRKAAAERTSVEPQ